MHKIASNIRHLRKLKNWSQEMLAEQLGISRASIGSYEESRCEPPLDTIINLSTLFHVAIDALVKCDLSGLKEEMLIKVGENRLLFPMMVDKDNNDKIEVVTIKASAGYLSGYTDPEYIEKLSLMNLPFKVVGKHRAFPIKGDSMLPLQSGSFVIGKYIEGSAEIKDGNTYIVITKDEGITYKRIYKKGKQLELHSDNKNYSPYTIKHTDVVELWQFVCSLNNTDTQEQEVTMASMMQQLQLMQQDIEILKRK